MGKASFIELQDAFGRIQVYISRDEICPGEDKELYNTVFKKLLDIGELSSESAATCSAPRPAKSPFTPRSS